MVPGGSAFVWAVLAIVTNVVTADSSQPLFAWLHPLWRAWLLVGVLVVITVVLTVLDARPHVDDSSIPAMGGQTQSIDQISGGNVAGSGNAPHGTVIQAPGGNVHVHPPSPSAATTAATPDTENGRRAQMLAATVRVYQTLSELKRLRPNPNQERDLRILLAETPEQIQEIETEGPRDEEGSQVWHRERDQLIQRLEVQALDIVGTEIRQRIQEARVIMECHEAPFTQAGQQESRTRYIAAEHAMKSLEAFRDGYPLPEPSTEYSHTHGFVVDFIAEWKASDRC
jgi:hypothetical protein